ncbi:MAG: hypothetical protein OEV21_03950 [Thermoplasmata archaeon]|nr:hypothetical protein [Thermoplasmata archaeon]
MIIHSRKRKSRTPHPSSAGGVSEKSKSKTHRAGKIGFSFKRNSGSHRKAKDDQDSHKKLEQTIKQKFEITGDLIAPPEEGQNYLFECQNCTLTLDIPFDNCPLCGGEMTRVIQVQKTIKSDVDADKAAKARKPRTVCPVCGSYSRTGKGCCVSCGTIFKQSSKDNKVQPIMPTKRLVFMHLDVESGKIEYIEKNSNRNKFGEFILDDGGI